MEKIFINVEDQDVAVYLVYTDASGNACSDSAATVKMATSELKQAFYVGCVIVANGVHYKPLHLKEAAGVATVTYATTDASSTTTAKLATVKSVANA